MKNILGSSPVSSIAGYFLAGLLILQEMTSEGETSWTKISVAIAIAVLGRIAKDGHAQ
jgi:hypothetical protein